MRIILAIGADLLKKTDGTIIVGTETARVLDAAVKLALASENSIIVVTAGKAPNYDNVEMGSGPMRDYLIGAGFPEDRIVSAVADEFTTNGEAATFVKLGIEKGWFKKLSPIFVVCRWWHLPRARQLVLARLSEHPRLRNVAWPQGVSVASRDVRGMFREPFALIKNWRQLRLAS